MNYEETLEKIHGFQTFGSKLGLERMNVLLKLLGNPEEGMKVIHVAGTNGKGSVCRYLTTILAENGYKVGLYTSPYLERFSERIEFDQKEIGEADLVDCAALVFEKVEEMCAQGFESPTEFELVTAIAFVFFRKMPMDILILEVGLGGRGDSTNVIKEPLASVITSISFDHTDVLGETISEIANEKAGIIKQSCPVISSAKNAEAKAVIKRVADENGCYYYESDLTEIKDIIPMLDGYRFRMKTAEGERDIALGMLGRHQIENAVLAVCVNEILEKRGMIRTSKEAVALGLRKARHNGRLEVLRENPLLIIDGAHNEGGAQALSAAIKEQFDGKRILLILGVLADKKIDRIISAFADLEADMAATEPDNPRRLSAVVLCEIIEKTGRPCIMIGDYTAACDYAEKAKENYDLILFSGSLYLIGRVRERFKNEVK